MSMQEKPGGGKRPVSVIVCGARDWKDRGLIHQWLAKLPKGSIVVHGAATGADTIAGEEAERLGHAVYAFPADWEKYGKGAGPLRNQKMLAATAPDLVLAFTYIRKDAEGHKEITTGTADMVSRALEAGVRVTIIPPRRLDVQSLMAEPGEP